MRKKKIKCIHVYSLFSVEPNYTSWKHWLSAPLHAPIAIYWGASDEQFQLIKKNSKTNRSRAGNKKIALWIISASILKTTLGLQTIRVLLSQEFE